MHSANNVLSPALIITHAQKSNCANHVIAGLQETLQRRADGRHAAGERQTSRTLLHDVQCSLGGLACRITQTRVNVSTLNTRTGITVQYTVVNVIIPQDSIIKTTYTCR